MIQVATTEDCENLAAVHVKSWQQGYVGLIPKWYLDALDIAQRAENWRRILRERSATVLLDFDEDKLTGFAALGPSRDDDADRDCGEISAVYYLRPYWGTGRSSQLLSAALDHLGRTGFQRVTLWVLHENQRAIAFYRKFGFEFDGEERIDERERFILREVRMCG